jgi:hypothetical protein
VGSKSFPQKDSRDKKRRIKKMKINIRIISLGVLFLIILLPLYTAAQEIEVTAVQCSDNVVSEPEVGDPCARALARLLQEGLVLRDAEVQDVRGDMEILYSLDSLTLLLGGPKSCFLRCDSPDEPAEE